MRSQTAPEIALLAGPNYGVFQRTKIANGSGTLIDYSDWVEKIGTDEDIDQPTMQATVELRRDSSSVLSLAPLREDSTLNRLDNGVTYAPALDANRLIVIDVATVAIGATPAGADWHELFRGYISSVDAASSTVRVIAQDLGKRLVRRWIKTVAEYGNDDPIEQVMQDLIDATLGAGQVTLAVIGTPDFNIRTYTQQSEPLMSALQTMAQERAWDVRYKWDDATSSFKLTLFEPDRAQTVPDRTFGPSLYFDVTRFEISDLEVRNYITINWRNSANGYAREDMTTSDATSITRYDEQFFGLTLGDESTVDTSAEVSLLIGNILLDLKDPKAEQEIEAQFFWAAELGDLYRFSANAVHYNTDQDLAVTNIRHELQGGTGRTYLPVRGKPAGGFLSWLTRGSGGGGGGGGTAPETPPAVLSAVLTEPTTQVLRLVVAFNASTVLWRAWARRDGSPLTGGQPQDEYLRYDGPTPPTQIEWSAVSDAGPTATWTVVVRAYSESGTYAEETVTLATTGIPPEVPVPTLIDTSDPGEPEANWNNTNLVANIRLEWWESAMQEGAYTFVSTHDLAPADNVESTTIAADTWVKFRIQYYNAFGDGPWSALSDAALVL